MNLKKYINSFPRHQRGIVSRELADKLGVHPSSVDHWRNGTRKMRPSTAKKLEKITNGKVTRYDLRPDLYE